jgi:hypothetical protein
MMSCSDLKNGWEWDEGEIAAMVGWEKGKKWVVSSKG